MQDYSSIPLDDKLEEWASVYGYEGLYEVSNLGRVRSLLYGGGVGASRVLKPGVKKRGYKYVVLACNGVAKTHSVHCLVASAFLGEPAPGFEVNHINRDPRDNRIENLEYMTHLENIRYRLPGSWAGVGAPYGERNGSAKLTEANVIEIKRRLAEGAMQKTLAAEYNVSQLAIHKIATGKTWKHLLAG